MEGKGGVCKTQVNSFLSVSNLHAQTHKKNNENLKQETFPV